MGAPIKGVFPPNQEINRIPNSITDDYVVPPTFQRHCYVAGHRQSGLELGMLCIEDTIVSENSNSWILRRLLRGFGVYTRKEFV
jgi:hypothetical protein